MKTVHKDGFAFSVIFQKEICLQGEKDADPLHFFHSQFFSSTSEIPECLCECVIPFTMLTYILFTYHFQFKQQD